LKQRLRGYRSRGEFVASAVRDLLDEFAEELAPRLEHFNVYENHVTVFDRVTKRIVDVYFKRDKPYCEACEAFDCEHIRFALSLPKVVEPLEKNGWIIRDGRVISGPQ